MRIKSLFVVFISSLLLCSIVPNDAQAYPFKDVSYKEEGRHKRLRRISTVDSITEKSSKAAGKGSPKSKSKKTSKSPEPNQKPSSISCTGEDMMPCGKNGYLLCLFDESERKYDTFCSTGKHSKSTNHIIHEKDYCGKCSIARQFIHDSLVTDIESANGTEYVSASYGDIFKADYDVEFNNFGFISLASSQGLILDVICTKLGEEQGSVEITFMDDFMEESNLVSRMFPQGSLLAIDGIVFGTCESSLSQDASLDGFLLIETVSVSGPVITLLGELAHVNYFFKHLSISYSLLERRKLALGAQFSVELPDFVEPKDDVIAIKSSLTFSGRAFMQNSNFDWSFVSRSFTISCEFGFQLTVDMSSALILKVEPIANSGSKIFDIGINIPVYGLPMVGLIPKIVKKFVPESKEIDLATGLYVEAPIKLEAEVKALDDELELAGLTSTATTGEKHLKFEVSSESLLPNIHFITNEPANMESNVSTLDKNDFDFLNTLQVEGFVGFMPQINLKAFGLASGALGIHAGFDFESKVTTSVLEPVMDEPGLPLVLRCDKCHQAEINLAAGVKDPFLFYAVGLLEKKKEYELPDFPSTSVDILKLCLLEATCPYTETIIDIEANDANVATSGGEVNTNYTFSVKVNDIPDGIDNIRLEWTPGYGAGASALSSVVDSKSEFTIHVSYSSPGTYVITTIIYNNEHKLATKSVQLKILGTTLAISPPGLQAAKPGEVYRFHFEANGIPSNVKDVVFRWNLGAGSTGTGSSGTVPVNDGSASVSVDYAYDTQGGYGVVAEVRNISTNQILATHSVLVIVGQADVQRNITLEICNTWSVSQDGGQGVTIDNWDISMIPQDAVFDLYFDAYSIPDKFLVQYPVGGNLVLDTGWRGQSFYDGSSLYPGGVSGPGSGTESGTFSRLSNDYFSITVIGPDSGTRWEYQVRCHG